MKKTNTSMMIDRSTLTYFGDTVGPVAVYDAATLEVLGRTDGPVARDGSVFFGGCRFTTHRAHASSTWLLLHFTRWSDLSTAVTS